MTVKLITHHGNEVWADDTNAGTHRENCLCYKGCVFFHPDQPDNCNIAQALYELDVKFKLVTPVYECPRYMVAMLDEATWRDLYARRMEQAADFPTDVAKEFAEAAEYLPDVDPSEAADTDISYMAEDQ